MDGIAKINRDEFLDRVALRLQNYDGTPPDTESEEYSVEEVCSAMLDEIVAIVMEGRRLSITGFGSFYSQMHRGHPVQFGGVSSKITDYRVFKFAPSHVLNKRLRSEPVPAGYAVK